MIGATQGQGLSGLFRLGRPASGDTASGTPPVDGGAAGLSLEGEGASQPGQDKAAASIISNLPRACPDGCPCAACNPSDPLAAFKARDAEVEKHEQAHLQTAGPDALGQPVFETQTGPDGKSYRVGGHVQVSLNEDESQPEDTLQRMQRVEKAALAPDAPSGQDQNVAQQARGKAAKAQSQIQKNQSGGSTHGTPKGSHGTTPGTSPNGKAGAAQPAGSAPVVSRSAPAGPVVSHTAPAAPVASTSPTAQA